MRLRIVVRERRPRRTRRARWAAVAGVVGAAVAIVALALALLDARLLVDGLEEERRLLTGTVTRQARQLADQHARRVAALERALDGALAEVVRLADADGERPTQARLDALLRLRDLLREAKALGLPADDRACGLGLDELLAWAELLAFEARAAELLREVRRAGRSGEVAALATARAALAAEADALPRDRPALDRAARRALARADELAAPRGPDRE